MTRVYIVRHCETQGNANHIFQGHCDLPVTDLGELQLAELSKRFENVHLDKVYTSPLRRTRKTAAAIIGKKDITPIVEEGLIEINGGICEEKEFTKIAALYPELWEVWTNHPQDFAPAGGEKMIDAYERIWDTVKNLAQQNKGKTIACASHGGVLRCLLCRFLKKDIKELGELGFLGNTAVNVIDFDDEFNSELVIYNDTTHLSENLQNPNSGIPSR